MSISGKPNEMQGVILSWNSISIRGRDNFVSCVMLQNWEKLQLNGPHDSITSHGLTCNAGIDRVLNPNFMPLLCVAV